MPFSHGYALLIGVGPAAIGVEIRPGVQVAGMGEEHLHDGRAVRA
jgi:hypothetical protein